MAENLHPKFRVFGEDADSFMERVLNLICQVMSMIISYMPTV